MINIKTLAQNLVKKGVIEKTSQLDYLFCITDNGNLKEIVGFAHDCFCQDCKKEREMPNPDLFNRYDLRYDLDGNLVTDEVN
jgi:hypothetical protein